jgi:hypothetical protein
MKTNSTTEFHDDTSVIRTCKVDSILSVVQCSEMFAQSQIRCEKLESSRCIFQIRYMNDGAASDAWLDGTEIDSNLMRAWIKNRSRSSRTMSPHAYATFQFESYFAGNCLISAGLAICQHGKYKGKSCKDIFDKDPGYCICMLEIFAESGSKIKAKDEKSMGHFCRYLSTLLHAKQFYLHACRCTACVC